MSAKQLIEQIIIASKSGALVPKLQDWVADHLADHFKKVKQFTKKVESFDKDNHSPEREKAVQEARSNILVMRSALSSCPSKLCSLDEFKMVSASIHLRLGLNFMAEEEFAAGEKALESCYNLLREVAGQWLLTSLYESLTKLVFCALQERIIKGYLFCFPTLNGCDHIWIYL